MPIRSLRALGEWINSDHRLRFESVDIKLTQVKLAYALSKNYELFQYDASNCVNCIYSSRVSVAFRLGKQANLHQNIELELLDLHNLLHRAKNIALPRDLNIHHRGQQCSYKESITDKIHGTCSYRCSEEAIPKSQAISSAPFPSKIGILTPDKKLYDVNSRHFHQFSSFDERCCLQS